jgi:hypothetical protein
MNIFILHHHPTTAASYLCNAHVRSQIRESILMLMSAYIIHENEMPADLPEPDLKHLHHPCTVWVCEHVNHWNWLYKHVGAIFKEYKALHGVPHYWEQYYTIISEHPISWKLEHRKEFPHDRPPPSVVSPDLKPHPDFDYSWDLVVEAYRKYYIRDKAHLHRWTKPRRLPDWIVDVPT